MTTLCCRLIGYPALRMTWDDALQPALAGLQALLGGHLQPEDGDADCVLRNTAEPRQAGIVYDDARRCFCYQALPAMALQRRVYLWRAAITSAAVRRLLLGEQLCLMHGCLLRLPEGGGLLLCGQSGMGKSTTANRWKAAGGLCPADDMVLLEWTGNALYAHPLPTWSRCIESVENKWYPFEDPLKVRGILALSRDDTAEEIRSFEPFKYLSVLYSSCCLFNRNLSKYLPAEEQKAFIHSLQSCAKYLSSLFPPQALFANPQSDLKETLRSFNYA